MNKDEQTRQDEADVMNPKLNILHRLQCFECILNKEGFDGRAGLIYTTRTRMKALEELIVRLRVDVEKLK